MGTCVPDSLFLGFDLSTQSLKCIVLNESLILVHEESVVYSRDLPSYQTTDGFHKSGNVVTSPVAMWIEALDLMLSKLKNAVPLSSVVGIGGCAQQHGTVYTAPSFLSSLSSLDPALPMHPQLGELFAVANSPIWMDNSTEDLCEEMEKRVGGPEKLAELTGSKAHCRFSVHQIYKIVRAGGWEGVERVLLVSNFLASLLTGQYVTPELSDASGMNLLDIKRKEWDLELATLHGVDVREKLGVPGPALSQEGMTVSRYLVERYSLPPTCRVSRFVGDNPATLIGLNLASTDIALSLGTSDVLIRSGESLVPSPETHTFCHPLRPLSHYMQILCYKNASLVREELKAKYCEGSWERFEKILKETKTDLVAVYFPQPEILPFGITGTYSNGPEDLFGNEPAHIVTSVTEGQFLAKANHCSPPPSRVVVVGGGSSNSTLLSLIANVFAAPVYRDVTGNVAALGAAYLGAMMAGREVQGRERWELVAEPEEGRKEEWRKKREAYRVLESTF